jgi:hypothetical protein
MATIETSLHKSYQEGSWGLREALREIISNALDGETRYAHLGVGRMTLSYDGRSTVEVRNDGVNVPAKALLMGTSESRNDDRTIGQFGEGLPMALLVLAREGYGVEIDNGEERWRPAIVRSAKFGGEPVLHVETRKLRVDRDAFVVKVSGVRPDEWAEVKRTFLRLDTAFDSTATVAARSSDYRDARILLQPEYKGRIYNKGVFIMERADLMFGYDLHGQLNRDRSLMNEYELKNRLNGLLRTVASEDETFCEKFARLLLASEDTNLETQDYYADFAYSSDLADKMAELFAEMYGDGAFPVDVGSTRESDLAKQLGKTPVRRRGPVLKLLQYRFGSVEDLAATNAKAVVKTHNRSDLTPFEEHNLRGVELLLRAAAPDVSLSIRLVDYAGKDTEITFANNEVLLARKVCMSFERTLLLLVGAANRLVVKSGGRAEGETGILAHMVDLLFNNANDMGGLGLHLLSRSGGE